MILTERLCLRRWRDEDRAPFAAMNVDPCVMAYFPAPISAADSDRFVDVQDARIARLGWGCFAVESRSSGAFTGFVGLSEPPPWHPCGGSVEIGWRLARAHWGKGYAAEAARAALDAGFPLLARDEVLSFTARCNRPSRRVMEKLGTVRMPAGSRTRESPRGIACGSTSSTGSRERPGHAAERSGSRSDRYARPGTATDRASRRPDRSRADRSRGTCLHFDIARWQARAVTPVDRVPTVQRHPDTASHGSGRPARGKEPSTFVR